ncbi:MAG: preprotein translocase subunit YajC [Moorella humiferrea]|uniref:Preprotein translocase subunit YajC n=1 Tax=Neomoorella humiferrea TaxID=676965 RepID=A0A2T0AY56_9FIRM|nr:preprotein translocase subunit YajC [Moorella humiferrea]MBE3571962.1 preprotein translocase subunit YajC [Moorella humiferrea]PRR75822.1 preprotein translocase subunit YajC [Moorella humiferrea]
MQQWAGTIFYMLVFFAILYFLMIRPQQKQQKRRQEMLNSLKVDDRVVLAGGLHGRITKIKDRTIMVRIADKVEVEVDKAGVAYVPGQEE